MKHPETEALRTISGPVSDRLKCVLARTLDLITRNATGSVPLRMVGPDERPLLRDICGKGDVSIVAGHEPLWQAEMTAFLGVWHVQATDVEGNLIHDELEVGAVPAFVQEALHIYGGRIAPAAGTTLLDRIANAVAEWRPGSVNQTFEAEGPAADLARVLGRSPLTLARTSPSIRAELTAHAKVWMVEHLDASDTVVRQVIEIGDVPDAVCPTALRTPSVASFGAVAAQYL